MARRPDPLKKQEWLERPERFNKTEQTTVTEFCADEGIVAQWGYIRGQKAIQHPGCIYAKKFRLGIFVTTFQFFDGANHNSHVLLKESLCHAPSICDC